MPSCSPSSPRRRRLRLAHVPFAAYAARRPRRLLRPHVPDVLDVADVADLFDVTDLLDVAHGNDVLDALDVPDTPDLLDVATGTTPEPRTGIPAPRRSRRLRGTRRPDPLDADDGEKPTPSPCTKGSRRPDVRDFPDLLDVTTLTPTPRARTAMPRRPCTPTPSTCSASPIATASPRARLFVHGRVPDFEAYEQSIRAVTPEHAREVAADDFDPDNGVVVVVLPGASPARIEPRGGRIEAGVGDENGSPPQ